jgi:MoxR-like ATPase
MGKENSYMTDVKQFGEGVINNLEQVIVGKYHSVELIVIGLLCQGHVLIEDVPGVGKTMLARSLAKSLDCTFNRIQFTPDMLPSDVTGVSIFNQQNREFEFRPGPIMGQIILADEVNRATPKTQASLLEAMEERQVTVDGTTHPLPSPFMVLATQNPIEYEGTFPLPEAQLDRFLLRVRLGYPNPSEEIKVLNQQQFRHPIETLKPVVQVQDLLDAIEAVRAVYVAPSIQRYIIDLVGRTRQSGDVPGCQPARQPGVIPCRTGARSLARTRSRPAR